MNKRMLTIAGVGLLWGTAHASDVTTCNINIPKNCAESIETNPDGWTVIKLEGWELCREENPSDAACPEIHLSPEVKLALTKDNIKLILPQVPRVK